MPTVHLSIVEIDDTDSEVRRDTSDTAVTITDLPLYTLLESLAEHGTVTLTKVMRPPYFCLSTKMTTVTIRRVYLSM